MKINALDFFNKFDLSILRDLRIINGPNNELNCSGIDNKWFLDCDGNFYNYFANINDNYYNIKSQNANIEIIFSNIDQFINPYYKKTLINYNKSYNNEFAKEILDLLFLNKQLPYYSAERRIDIFINFFIEDILSWFYNKKIKYVTSEFPLKLDNNNQSNEVDYLCKVESESIILFVELKTDKKSLNYDQLSFYQKNNNWTDIINKLKTKLTSSNIKSEDRIKYYNLIKRLAKNNLINIAGFDIYEDKINKLLNDEEIDHVSKMSRSRAIIELAERMTPIASSMIEYVYISPFDDNFKRKLDSVNFKMLSFNELDINKINTRYKDELEILINYLKTI